MNNLDFIILGIIAISMLLGLLRGAVKEVLSLAAWIVAFIAGQSFAALAAQWMPAFVSNPSLRYLGGFLLVFVVVMALAMLLSLLLSESIKALGLGLLDRIIGIFFGGLRGMVIVTILVLLAGLTEFPKSDVWQQAMLSDAFQTLAVAVKPWLPVDLANHIHYR